MKHATLALVLIAVLATFSPLWADVPSLKVPRIVPDDPSQNPLAASGTISAGLSGTLDARVKLRVSVSNPSAQVVGFTLAKAVFVQGSKQKGHPLYAEQLDVEPLAPGVTTTLRFQYPNPQAVPEISAYVLLRFTFDGQPRRTALFVSGPHQKALIDKWDQTFFPYGHETGFLSTTAYVQAPYWGTWDDFAPFWW